MLVLGIETSCDETSVSLVSERKLLSNVIFSQDEIHAQFGGVVPELAGRRHIEVISAVSKEALSQAGVSLEQVEGIAVTRGPGLVVCLLVGLSFAKAIAWSRGLPLVGVNHLEGHLLAIFLEKPDLKFPFLGLLASGGHTLLSLVEGWGRYQVLGETRDDAAGEALDKAGKLLGLPYPGGKEIDRLSQKGNPRAVEFPIGLNRRDELDYSFSGLKTALLRYLRENPEAEEHLEDLSASYQEAVVSALLKKTLWAREKYQVERIVLSGGVASNRRLREAFSEQAERLGFELYIPSPRLCTDNAGMIALVGEEKLKRGLRDDYRLDARAVLPLENWQ